MRSVYNTGRLWMHSWDLLLHEDEEIELTWAGMRGSLSSMSMRTSSLGVGAIASSATKKHFTLLKGLKMSLFLPVKRLNNLKIQFLNIISLLPSHIYIFYLNVLNFNPALLPSWCRLGCLTELFFCSVSLQALRLAAELIQRAYCALANHWPPAKLPVVYNLDHQWWHVKLLLRQSLNPKKILTQIRDTVFITQL